MNYVFLVFKITSLDNKDEKQFLWFSFWEFNSLVWLDFYNLRKFIQEKISHFIDSRKLLLAKVCTHKVAY